MATGRRRGRAIIYIALILILLLVLAFVAIQGNLLGGQSQTPPSGDATQGVPAAEAVPTLVPPAGSYNIVVIAQDVRRGQVLTDDLLAVVPIPEEQYTEDLYFSDKVQVSGARARFDMKARTPVTEALIVAPGSSGSILSFEIPAGKVAISVPISKLSSVSYGLQKGDRVNVIVSLLMVDLDSSYQSRLPNRTGVVIAPGPINEDQVNVTSILRSPEGFNVVPPDAYSYYGRVEVDPTTGQPVYIIPGEAQRPRLVSQTLIQDVTVLQIGEYREEPAAPAAAEAPTDAAVDPNAQPTAPVAQDPNAPPVQAVVPDVVTLIVNPQDAVSLNYLMLAGANLNLVLRSAADDSRVDTEAATLQFILDQYRIPNPAKLPYGTEPRTDEFPSTIPPFPEPGARPTPTPAGG